ncbi:unnamed protein product [Cercopithifilaria johnstoni]|uniref:Uncharacterized protein n=1 Tax=Cercopithifilaria johnstoni TaxID=2874296 RepID=A0A8J2Q905_9BILA|nr:unnamed protein product [Cercopithifilaria johnstoni]
MEPKIIVASAPPPPLPPPPPPSLPMVIHYEHLAHHATTATAPSLAHIRNDLQISLQSSVPSSTSSSSTSTTSSVSYVENVSLQKREKLIAKMCNELQRRIPFKKKMVNFNKMSRNRTTTDNNVSKSRSQNHVYLAPTKQTNCLLLQRSTNIATNSFFQRAEVNMRNNCDNKQSKYYSNQRKNSGSEKFFKRHVTRQASFLAAVSASNSHRGEETRSFSTHDLRLDLNHSKKSHTWQDAGSTNHLTSYHANTARSDESSLTAVQRFSAHALDSSEIKNYSNLPHSHSAYYVAPENNFLNDIRCNDSTDQERQIVKKILNIPKISHYSTTNEGNGNSTSIRRTNITSKALINVPLVDDNIAFKINPIERSNYSNGTKINFENFFDTVSPQ